MKNVPIFEIMTSPLVTVAPEDTVADAAALMEKLNVHHLLVVEAGRMAGILSSSDLLKLALLQPPGAQRESTGGESLVLRVRDVMQSHVAVVRQNACLEDVARALSLGGFHAVPVLAIDGTPIGIVTTSDLICLLIDRIEREPSRGLAAPPPSADARASSTSRLLEVLRSAEIYLNSGHSEQQHARLTRAVAKARESVPERMVGVRGFEPPTPTSRT
jgi:acetoin utilization protein AcuB